MHPDLIKLGPITLHTYGFFLAVAFLVAMFFIQRDAKRYGLNPAAMSDMAFGALLAGIVGSRIFHIVMYPEFYSWSQPLEWFAIWRGGLVFQGGFVAALIFCLWFARYKKIELGKAIDASMPYLPLGHAIGRLGCFFGIGCCYGGRTDMPWGVCFPRIPADVTVPATGSEPYLTYRGETGAELWSPPLHPTQLYEAAGLLIIAAVLLYARKRWHPFNGFIMPLYMVSYGILRFINEFFRGDGNPVRIAHLTDQQIISLLTVAAGIAIFAVFQRKKRIGAAAAR